MTKGIVDSLLSMAFEAEDITKETKRQSERVDEGAPDKKSSDIDMNTNDILGTKGDDENDTSDDADTEDTDTGDETDDVGDDTDDTDEGDDTDTSDDDSGMDDSDSTGDIDGSDAPPPEEISNVKKKINLKKNVITLYNIIKSNIDTLSKYNPDNVGTELYDKFFKVQTHLATCRDILFDLGTDEINTAPYLVSLRKYTTVKQVYDICILMLDRFYDTVKIANGLKEGVKNENM